MITAIRASWRCAFVAGLLLLLAIDDAYAGVTPDTPSATLYIVGDSWADELLNVYGTLDAELSQRGLADTITVRDFAVGGSTAQGWAADEVCLEGPWCEVGALTQLAQSVATDPSPIVLVALIVGGNDVNLRYRQGPASGDAVFDEIEADLATILHVIKVARPDARALLISYDILSFNQSLACWLTAVQLYGVARPAHVNALTEHGVQHQAAAAMAATNARALNVVGALQGNPGAPDLSSYSPATLVAADCLHLTAAGYAIYVDAIFDRLLGQDEGMAR